MQRAIRAAVHGEGRPWYARSPGKEILAHVASVATAVGLGFAIHHYTGEPVTIEADRAPAIKSEPASVDLLAERSAEIAATYEAVDAAPAVAAAAPRVKRAAAPAPAAAAPAAAAPPVIDEVPIGGAR
jgi:hypothetical protein